MSRLYGKLPYALQCLAVNFYGFNIRRKRYNAEFLNVLERYRRIDRQEIHCLNFAKVKDMISGSAFYSFDAPDEFYRLPLLTKDIAKKSYDLIANKQYSDSYLSTSGTTGSAFRMPVSREFIYNQWAVFWKFRMIHGMGLDSWCAYFIGRNVVSKKKHDPPYWIKSYPTNQMLFSISHLNRDSIESYLDAIKRNNIHWIHAYPSVLNLLTELISEKKLSCKAKGLKLGLITTSSEILSDCQKQNIEALFGCRVRQLYGLTEGVANIFECEEGKLHVDESFSFVEFIKDNNRSGYYKIVGTHYYNKAFPLVRYDTGDYALLDESGSNCPCGRRSRVISEISGREQDYILLADTSKAVAPDLIFKNVFNVHKVQIIQKRKGYAEFYIVRGDKYGEHDEQLIRKSIIEYLGKGFEFDIIYSADIPLVKNGKAPFVVSNLE